MEQKNLILTLEERFQYSHKKAKFLLANRLVQVNGVIQTQYDWKVSEKDSITILKRINPEIPILYEDKNLIVVEKKAGLLTVSTKKEKEKTLYYMVSEYVKQKNKQAKIFVIHRLDQETSGLVMFAKKEAIQKKYQKDWNKLVTHRGYYAVVEGRMPKKEDTVTVLLRENKQYKMFVTEGIGEKAITTYQVIKETETHSLLKIELKTGKKNQIRATMEYLGHPIVGDIKYGATDKSQKRLLLHAYLLSFFDPIEKKKRTFELPLPPLFEQTMKRK